MNAAASLESRSIRNLTVNCEQLMVRKVGLPPLFGLTAFRFAVIRVHPRLVQITSWLASFANVP